MSSSGKNIRINGERLWDSLVDMAEIGPGIAGGNNRQTLTDDDAKGRELFQKWCVSAGCSMGLDSMGNMFATRPGADPEALPVYVGSHLDTQPTGGKYDGVLGVLGGLELIRTLNDLNIKTKHPIVVTNWTNEEGTRFAPAMLASGVFAGIHTQDWAYDRVDAKGKRFGDELQRIGWDRANESIYLERAFGHSSRHRLTRFSDLVAYLKRLRELPASSDAKTAGIPLRRSDLVNQCDEILKRLNWEQQQAREFLQSNFQVGSRQQLSDEQLLGFNMLLEEQLLK